MRFPYLALPTSRPIPSLAQATVRHRPIVPVRISGRTGSRLLDCSLDCGTDDTIFPRWLADKLGIDLTNVETGEAKPIGTSSVLYCSSMGIRISGLFRISCFGFRVLNIRERRAELIS